MQTKTELTLIREEITELKKELLGKTEIQILRARLLTSIRYSTGYKNDKLGIEFKIIPNAFEGSMEGQEHLVVVYTLCLDEKLIVELNNNTRVLRINFHNRYDSLIRLLLETFDVEVHRFGSIWIGEISPDPVAPVGTIQLKLAMNSIRLEELLEREKEVLAAIEVAKTAKPVKATKPPESIAGRKPPEGLAINPRGPRTNYDTNYTNFAGTWNTAGTVTVTGTTHYTWTTATGTADTRMYSSYIRGFR